jgi:hypothetical protein
MTTPQPLSDAAALLAHISTPKPDCRLCKNYRQCSDASSTAAGLAFFCKDFSKFQYAEAAQLCEVTK